MEGLKSKCAECGLTGDFCGYHNLGSQKVSLCLACAETEVDVWRISLHGEGGGCVAPTITEAVDSITALIGEMDNGDGYDISKERLSKLSVVGMSEFQGF